MAALLKENLFEAIVGALVIAVAIGFVAFAYGRTAGGLGERYAVTARFPNVTGVATGTDVRLSGMKVGTVTAQELDPATYQAVLTLGIDSTVKLPADSSAAITSEGLLGGSYIALTPGGDPAMLRPGDEITDTQGATDLMGLIGGYINRPAEPAPAAPAPAAPAP